MDLPLLEVPIEISSLLDLEQWVQHYTLFLKNNLCVLQSIKEIKKNDKWFEGVPNNW